MQFGFNRLTTVSFSFCFVALELFSQDNSGTGKTVITNDASLRIAGYFSTKYIDKLEDGRDEKKGNKKNKDYGFYFGLARLTFNGNLINEKIGYVVQLQASPAKTTSDLEPKFVVAQISYQFNSFLKLAIGRIVIPYSREWYTHPSGNLSTSSSITDDQFALTRASGVLANGGFWDNHVQYYLMTFNRTPKLMQNSSSKPGHQEETNKRLSSMGRLELNLMGGGYGYTGSNPTPEDIFKLSVGGATIFSPIDYDIPNIYLNKGDTSYNYTYDFGARYSFFTSQGGYYIRRSVFARRSRSDRRNDDGFFLQFGVLIGKTGLEIGGRYSQYILNKNKSDAVPLSENLLNLKRTEQGVFINYYIEGDHAKIQLELNTAKTFSNTTDRYAPYMGNAIPVKVEKQIRFKGQLLF
ncbi:hypothetical protein [Leptospira ilyithenensis]|uniref:Porin n=1 Tax=Leptospira ilyithenensis TaxID=2484901 RepID=A0A4R9LU93_9LEPT|nr:hypothetical protein [Leptospira ilyithenensis]TGN14282.1 hypothetical protein EHS11_02045 [Leptospira ilyithenensis]